MHVLLICNLSQLLDRVWPGRILCKCTCTWAGNNALVRAFIRPD